VRAWRWTCGVKPTPKAVNKPWQHCIVHGLDKPGVFTTDSKNPFYTRPFHHYWRGTGKGDSKVGSEQKA
jgi:hypothetical protein